MVLFLYFLNKGEGSGKNKLYVKFWWPLFLTLKTRLFLTFQVVIWGPRFCIWYFVLQASRQIARWYCSLGQRKVSLNINGFNSKLYFQFWNQKIKRDPELHFQMRSKRFEKKCPELFWINSLYSYLKHKYVAEGIEWLIS